VVDVHVRIFFRESSLADRLLQASPALLRGLPSAFIHALMGVEADAICGAGYRQRSTSD
jgi:transposase-like protein